MQWLGHLFGIHLSVVQIALLVFGLVLIIHFLVLSKDFRTFVVLGLFGFAGSFGKMMGILIAKAILAVLRTIKVFFMFQIYAFQEIARSIRDEAEGIDDIGKPES